MSLNLPSKSTDSYRLLNGEGDIVSGLAIDILGGQVAVVMLSAAWCEIYKDTQPDHKSDLFEFNCPI